MILHQASVMGLDSPSFFGPLSMRAYFAIYVIFSVERGKNDINMYCININYTTSLMRERLKFCKKR